MGCWHFSCLSKWIRVDQQHWDQRGEDLPQPLRILGYSLASSLSSCPYQRFFTGLNSLSSLSSFKKNHSYLFPIFCFLFSCTDSFYLRIMLPLMVSKLVSVYVADPVWWLFAQYLGELTDENFAIKRYIPVTISRLSGEHLLSVFEKWYFLGVSHSGSFILWGYFL